MFKLNSFFICISQSIKVRLIVCFVNRKTLACLPASSLHNLKNELCQLGLEGGDWRLGIITCQGL